MPDLSAVLDDLEAEGETLGLVVPAGEDADAWTDIAPAPAGPPGQGGGPGRFV